MKLLRGVLERASRGILLQRRLPTRFGRGSITVTPEAALRYWHPNLERVDPTLLNAAEELVSCGNVVWDIGANVGLFAFAAAALSGSGGKVLAVEPDIKLCTLLQKSSRRESARAHVDVLCAAVSERLALSRLQIASRGRASNSLGCGSSQAGGARESQSVLTVTLDWLGEAYAPPDVIKIDVEGSESGVLAGGKNILRNSRPKIFCEVSDENRSGVTRIFSSHEYAMFDGDKPKERREQLQSAAWNTIAYPIELVT